MIFYSLRVKVDIRLLYLYASSLKNLKAILSN